MSIAGPRKRLKKFLNGEECIRPVSVYDPISARIAADTGFELGMYAGSVASLTVLGAPDIILLTLSEFAAQARRICRASDLPVMCDADHGYGNALNVMRTVEELENAGIAGLTIEDTELPRQFGSTGLSPLPVAEGIGKMRAAVNARRDTDICIFARTGAIGMIGLDDGIERLKAYQDSGVDGVFLTGVSSRVQIERISEVARIPILLGALGPDIDNTQFLSEHGIKVALMGHQPFMAAAEAVRACMEAQRHGKPLPALVSKPDLEKFTRKSDYDQWTKDYL